MPYIISRDTPRVGFNNIIPYDLSIIEVGKDHKTNIIE